MKKLPVMVLGFFLLSGCVLSLPKDLGPTDSGSIVVCPVGGHSEQVVRTELSPAQINGLRLWLHDHKTGWKFEPTDTPQDTGLLYAPRGAEEIFLTRSKATVVWIDLLGDEIHVGLLAKTLTPDERSEIRNIAGTRNN